MHSSRMRTAHFMDVPNYMLGYTPLSNCMLGYMPPLPHSMLGYNPPTPLHVGIQWRIQDFPEGGVNPPGGA